MRLVRRLQYQFTMSWKDPAKSRTLDLPAPKRTKCSSEPKKLKMRAHRATAQVAFVESSTPWLGTGPWRGPLQTEADTSVKHLRGCVFCCWNVYAVDYCMGQWFPNFLDAFLPLHILELWLLPWLGSWASIKTAVGTMVFVDDNNLISKSGTETICCQIMELSQQKRVIVD